ncbi:preprotein translocase subunit SecG [Candidatus Woesebacteria bacterium]|nr:preprotein translocase subunit SecG [Candidatus Woesebacteria bacterium]
MNNVLYIIQSVIALFLIGLIVLQAKGTGLGRSFASSNYHAKRGMERTVFGLTITAALIFLVLSVIIAF